MKQDDAPEVIDLDRYKAAQAAAKAKDDARLAAQAKAARKAQKAGGSTSILGSRPKAGLILALIGAAAFALLILPRLLT